MHKVGFDIYKKKNQFAFEVSAIHQAFSYATFSHLDHGIALCSEGRLNASFEHWLERGPCV